VIVGAAENEALRLSRQPESEPDSKLAVIGLGVQLAEITET
jgi:hypothetical protein